MPKILKWLFPSIKGNNQRDRKSKKELWNRAFSFFTALWIIDQIFISEFYKTNQQVAPKFHYSLVTSVIKFTNMRFFCVALNTWYYSKLIVLCIASWIIHFVVIEIFVYLCAFLSTGGFLCSINRLSMFYI